jgi:hypothetical protein
MFLFRLLVKCWFDVTSILYIPMYSVIVVQSETNGFNALMQGSNFGWNGSTF